MYMKRDLLKLDYLFCIVFVCSEPQQVFKYMEYIVFKIIFISSYFEVLFPTRLIKLDATAYFQCANDDVKSVKQHTRNLYFAEKYMFLRRE